MGGINDCAIPGCTYTRCRSSEKRTIFTIHRPDLARNEDERSHGQLLTKFILSMRDAKSGLNNISLLLHRERLVKLNLYLHVSKLFYCVQIFVKTSKLFFTSVSLFQLFRLC